MKLEKPGKPDKKTKIQNKRGRSHDLDKPKKTHCRICMLPDDGTCYYHHPEAPWIKHHFGFGMRKKVIDDLVVWAHHECGIELSKQPLKSASQHEHGAYEIKWHRAILLTMFD